MEDLFVGILAIVVGAAFCFRGYLALRVIIPIWGSFAGFLLGAGLVANTGDAGFLRTTTAWFVGLALALVFGALAYFYYEFTVILAMASIGFALGTSLMVALGVSWSWLIVLVGVAVGTVLAAIAIVADLPAVALAVLSAFAGASTMVAGVMLLVGAVETDDFTSATATQRLDDSWWWYALYVALAVVGLVAQLSAVERLRVSLRASWAEAGGRELRAT